MVPQRPFRSALLLLAAAAAAGCTPMTATPYQPYRARSEGGVHGGFSEQQIAPDHYLVRFHGNGLTSRDRVEGYMLYRAADLTVQNGFDWFMILDRNTEHDVRTIVRPEPSYHPWFGGNYIGWRPDWNVYSAKSGWVSWSGLRDGPSWDEQVDVRHIEAFEATAEVQMHKGSVPRADPRAIDARKVLSELGPSIERPKT